MNLKNINFNFVFQLVAILSLIIIYIFQWGVMITSPSLRTGTDFMAFYSAGRVAQQYGIENAYKIPLQHKIQEEVVGFPILQEQILIYIHIPAIIPILFLLISENYVISFFIWTFLMLVIYGFAIFRLTKAINLNKNNLLIILGSILFFPLFQSLLLGQDSAILFLGLVLWLQGMTSKNDWVAATGLVLTAIRPHFSLLFLISAIFYDYRKSWKYILGMLIFTFINMFLMGKEGTFDFINILQVSASGKGHGTNEISMFNLIGLIVRSLPFLDIGMIRVTGWIGYATAILILPIIWGWKNKSLEWLISITILLTLFLAPHLHYHDLVLLIVPLILLKIKTEQKINLIFGISMASTLFVALHFILPYLLYIVLFIYLLKTKKIPQINEPSRNE